MATNGNFSGLTAAQLVGTIRANNAVPVTLAEQLRGSLRTVASISEREAIPGRKLDNGMIVYVEGTNTFYTYRGGTRSEDTGIMTGGVWSTFSSGSGGSTSGAGLREWDDVTDYAANDVVIYDGGFFFASSAIATSGTCSVGTHTSRGDCTDAGGTFTGTANANPETTNAPWTRIHLDNVEHWDGGELRKNDGSTYTVSELLTAQDNARGHLGGNSTESIDGFMSSEDKTQLNDLPETWVSGTTYSPTDQVSFSGKVYTQIAENDSSSTTDPSATASIWRQTGIVPSYIQSSTGTVVTMGDSRTTVPNFNIASATTTAAGVMSATDKSKLDDQVVSWDSSTSYSTGDLVAYEGAIYKSVSTASQSNHQPDTDQGTCSVSNSTTRGACNTAGGDFVPIWEEIGVVDLTTVTTNNTVTVRSSTGLNAVISAANLSNAGAMTQDDVSQLDSLPQEWSSSNSVDYEVGDQVSFEGKLYSVLTAHTSDSGSTPTTSTDPENFVVLSSTGISLGTVDVDSVSISTTDSADAVELPAALTTAAGVMTAADKTALDTLVSTIGEKWDTTSVATAYSSTTTYNLNDKVSFDGVVYISISTATHSDNEPSSTSTFWTEMIEFLQSRDLGVFTSDPTNLRDGQVWYNSVEDLVKYFTLDTTQPTDQTSCEAADNGVWDGTNCSGAGETSIVAHTATEFETTSISQPDTGVRARVVINDASIPTGGGIAGKSALLTFNDNSGNAISVFSGVAGASLGVFTHTTGNDNLSRWTIGGLSVGGSASSVIGVAVGMATEITAGNGVTGRPGFVWNINAEVDPNNQSALIFSRTDSEDDINVVVTDLFELDGIAFSNFSPSWTTNQTGLGTSSNPDLHLAVAGQRIITGSLSTFTPSIAMGRQAYIYLGADYITTDSDNVGETELDPEEHTQWTNITSSTGTGGTSSGISLATADSLYYRQDAADGRFLQTEVNNVVSGESTYVDGINTLAEDAVKFSSFITKNDVTTTETAVIFDIRTGLEDFVEAFVDIKVPEVTNEIVDIHYAAPDFTPGRLYREHDQVKSANSIWVLHHQYITQVWEQGHSYEELELGDLVTSNNQVWRVEREGIGISGNHRGVIEIGFTGTYFVGQSEHDYDNISIAGLGNDAYNNNNAVNFVFGASQGANGTTVITDSNNFYIPLGTGERTAEQVRDAALAALQTNTFTDADGTPTEGSIDTSNGTWAKRGDGGAGEQFFLQFVQDIGHEEPFSDTAITVHNSHIPYWRLSTVSKTSTIDYSYNAQVNILEFSVDSTGSTNSNFQVGRSIAWTSSSANLFGTPDQPDFIGNITQNQNIIGSTDRLIEVQITFGKSALTAAEIAGTINGLSGLSNIRIGDSSLTRSYINDGISGAAAGGAPETDPRDADGNVLFELYTATPSQLPRNWNHLKELVIPTGLILTGDNLQLDSNSGLLGSTVSISSWADYAMGGIFVSETSITGGSVIELTFGGVSIFREIIDSPYTDRIYSTNTSGVLTGLLSTRGA